MAEADEEAALERELEDQLVEHKASLAALREALLHDPGNQEITSLCEELLEALKGSEESLLYLKRSRLLREIDSLQGSKAKESGTESPQVEPVEQEDVGFIVGSKCRFRYTDGRWYNGKVIELEEGANARVSFFTPTNEKMQICRFHLQQRCRYGDSCRSSHGKIVPGQRPLSMYLIDMVMTGFRAKLSALKEFSQFRWEEIEVGSTVLACSSEEGNGVWRDAEVEAWDSALQRGRVVFIDDGRRSNVGVENLAVTAVTEHPWATDESSSSWESDEVHDESDSEIAPGFGYLNGVKTGQQTDTVTFAKWEKHTRGVGSRIMARMGYREGTGLGLSGQGIVAPLQVRVLPAKTSLDFINETAPENGRKESTKKKKKSRGGKRKRDKKFAEAARALKAQEAEEEVDVFGFINNQLASQEVGGSRKGTHSGGKKGKPKEDRRSLVKQEDEIKELASRVAKLEEMAYRNRKEKSVYEAVCRKLDEARKALSEAEAAHTSTAHAVRSKEQEKKWLRF